MSLVRCEDSAVVGGANFYDFYGICPERANHAFHPSMVGGSEPHLVDKTLEAAQVIVCAKYALNLPPRQARNTYTHNARCIAWTTG